MNTTKHPTPQLWQRPPFNRHKLFLTLAGLTAGLLAGGAVTAKTQAGEPGPLRVGVSPVFPPLVFKQGKELTGAEVALARALMKGSVDVVITDSTLVWYLAGTHATDGLAAVPFVLSEEVLAWGVRRGNDDLVAAANQFIERAAQDGTLTKTFRRWMAVE